MKCRYETLSRGEDHLVSRCRGCKRISLHFQSLLMSFTEQDFVAFKTSVTCMDFEVHAISFPNGQRKVILNSPHEDLRICFGLEELERFQDILNEVFLTITARGLVGAQP